MTEVKKTLEKIIKDWQALANRYEKKALNSNDFIVEEKLLLQADALRLCADLLSRKVKELWEN